MKYCLSSRQQAPFLKKCDEIRVWYRDIDIIYDLIENENYNSKTIILDIPNNNAEDVDWTVLKAFSEKINLIVCLHDVKYRLQAIEHSIRWYWAYPAFTWSDLHALAALKPCYIMVSAPLSMALDQVKKITDIPLRMVPNIAYDAYLPRVNGIKGQWVRPEDIEKYSTYIDAFEFLDVDLKKEATLFHIYAENGEWPGNLNIIITNLNFDIDNRIISDELIERRMNCGQRCMQGGNCNLCESEFHMLAALRHLYYTNGKKIEN